MLKVLSCLHEKCKTKVVIHRSDYFLMIPVMVENGVFYSNLIATCPGGPCHHWNYAFKVIIEVIIEASKVPLYYCACSQNLTQCFG